MLESSLLPAHRRYLWIDAGVGCVAATVVINALIAWLANLHLPRIYFWDGAPRNIVLDVIATSFLLPWLTCLILTKLTRNQIRSGSLPATVGTGGGGFVAWLPRRGRTRAWTLGVATLATFAPGLLAAMAVLEVTSLSVLEFVAFKSAYTGLLAAVIGPVVALCALQEQAETA